MTEKLFYEDSHMKRFTAVVTSCRPKDETYEVVLDRTAFFPEGGGQYADEGTLGDSTVLNVHEKEGIIIHVTDRRLEESTEVTGNIDWTMRFMKMQQHSGEHIVSGLVHARKGLTNVGFHLGSEDCTMDFNGDITREELEEIEQLANEAVWKNIPIQISYPSKEALDTLFYRSKIEIEGQVRIVTIEGYDVCACCAPHVKSTGEIGMIKLTNVQRYKGGVRVTMLCGSRALSDYNRKAQSAKEISGLLSAKEENLVDAVTRLKEEAAEQKENLIQMQRKILAYRVKEISTEQFVCLFEEDLEGDGPRVLMNLILEKGAKSCAVFQKTGNEEYRYVIGSTEADARIFSKGLQTMFQAKGGGKPEMVQGSLKGNSEAIRGWMEMKAREIKE